MSVAAVQGFWEAGDREAYIRTRNGRGKLGVA